MLMQIKETQAAASQREKYNNEAALQAGSYLLRLACINIQIKKNSSITNC